MRASRRRTAVAIVIAAAVLASAAVVAVVALPPSDEPGRVAAAPRATLTPEAPVVSVRDAALIDLRSGEPLVLDGVNWPGFEYACIQGRGHDDGGAEPAAVEAMLDWGVTAVRVPLNEQCWAENRPADAFGTAAGYRAAVDAWVTALTDAGLVVILDLHWSAPDGELADGLRAMPSAASIPFWSSVAETYRKHRAVVFDLFNEPASIYDADDRLVFELDWRCWAEGGCTPPVEALGEPLGGRTYPAVGMTELLGAVRGAGAPQPAILGGLDYANDLRGWLDTAPDDDQLIAGAHLYPDQRCADETCWNAELAPLAEQVPLLVSEFGQSDGGDDHLRRAFAWSRENADGALAWAWWRIEAGGDEQDARFALVEGDDFAPRSPSGAALREMLGG
ncbi:cellulase family glycosylhydrolase [Microcella daejeonensis]|uniref:Cellulase family glycosylhydrolase n=1 Tax=Microcella daejeonensis TaxID=2994971 RepID=A0A9E8MJ48_9MICO|nr:cellulase family glycosylhydrolase [Microcella daejeonensis]WAB80505.1 cellulase family glycosylhydrolase [Microcella daejeonensis]